MPEHSAAATGATRAEAIGHLMSLLTDWAMTNSAIVEARADIRSPHAPPITLQRWTSGCTSISNATIRTIADTPDRCARPVPTSIAFEESSKGPTSTVMLINRSAEMAGVHFGPMIVVTRSGAQTKSTAQVGANTM